MSTPVNFVKINVTSTGTGPLILGSAVPGNRGIEALINGRTYSYSIRQGVSAYEFGRATYLTSPSPRMIRSPLGSSRDGAPISLSTGAQVSMVLLVEDLEGLALPGGLAVENNLSDLADIAAARSNLSVYSRSEVDSSIASALLSALKFKATLDCSANPNYPAALVGDTYVVSVAGKIGGASGTAVDVGDWIIAEADNAGGTEAAVGASWGHIEHNLIGAAMLSGAAFTGPVSVPDDAYDEAGWNGSTQVPTKNAVRDKIEAMAAETAFIAANFSSIASTAIPAGVTSVHTLGYASAGDGGGGTYVNDATATSGFAATHPLACTVDGNGRYWRLLPEAGAISVEQLGAVGSMLDTVTTNQRVPIQSASNYALAVNCELLFTMPFYSYWQQARTYADTDVHASTEGVGFIVDGGHLVFRSTCGGTRIKRRAPNGGDPTVWANWPLLSGGAGWRGGLVFLKGTLTAPANFSDRSGLTLDGVLFDGGIARGSSYGALNTGTGDGWDTTDKGLWGEGDRYKGDIELRNGSGFIGCRGEVIYYQGGDKNDRTVKIRGGILGNTNGSGLNVEGATLDIDGLFIFKCSKWSESWGGPNGRVVNTVVYDCINDGFVQAGIPGQGGPPALISGIGYPTRYVADAYGPLGDGRLPTLDLQVTFVKGGTVAISPWTDVNIVAKDTAVKIGDNTQLLDSSYGLPWKQISGRITLVTDTVNNVANLTITGGQTAGKVNTDEISLDVKVQRTESAATSGYNYPRIYHERSLGPNIRINLDAPNGSSPPVTTLGLTDYMPIYSGTFWIT